MILHYLTSAFAKFRKSPFTTAANLLTLALGLACFIAAWGAASWWGSADHYHRAADRIFVVGQTNLIGQNSPDQGSQSMPRFAMSSWNLAGYLRTDFPELERVARAVRQVDMAVSAADQEAILNIAIADPEFLDIFDFEFVEGDAAALGQPNSAVLTSETAARLFGAERALGKSILINGVEEATVTGVIAPVRQPSFMGSRPDSAFQFDLLRDWESTPLGQQLDGLATSWIGVNPHTFVRLPPSMSLDAFNARLPEFLERRVPASDREAAQISMQAFPVSKLSTFSLDSTLSANGAGMTAVAALLGLAAITLGVACINYANLATAQAAAHARQIGLRRTLGARRSQVMLQNWLEAGVLSLAALVAALVLAALAAPAIRAATGLDILFFLSRGFAPFAVLAALAAGVALIAGAYPAFVLSRVRPIETLRGAGARSGPRAVARILVGVQFASASFLLIMVAVTQLQRSHIERTVLEPHEDPVVVLNDLMPLEVDYDTLADRLADQAGVRSVSVVDHMPWSSSYNGMFFARSEDPAAAAYPAFVKSVGYDYFETLELPLLAGRAFDRERDTRPAPLFIPSQQPIPAVIDRRYAEALGFAAPEAAVGEVIYIPASMAGGATQPVQIVGVAETERTRLQADASPGHIYTFGPRALWGQQRPIVRIARDDVPATMARIETVWDQFAPDIPLDARFFDALFEQSFRAYGRVSQIFMLLAGSAFIIASIGLLGIAVHVTARRRREIGVRKTLGSSTARVLRLLIWDFSKPVLIANIVAWPFAWVAAEIYLRSFADRTPLTPIPFILSLIVTLLIAWASVGGQAWRAATVKPANVLKYE